MMRVNGYDEPFRGRCREHLHPAVQHALHQGRNGPH
jgi:hypothetical protein